MRKGIQKRKKKRARTGVCPLPLPVRSLFPAGGMRGLDHVGSFYPQWENQLFIAAAAGGLAPAEPPRRDLNARGREQRR